MRRLFYTRRAYWENIQLEYFASRVQSFKPEFGSLRQYARIVPTRFPSWFQAAFRIMAAPTEESAEAETWKGRFQEEGRQRKTGPVLGRLSRGAGPYFSARRVKFV